MRKRLSQLFSAFLALVLLASSFFVPGAFAKEGEEELGGLEGASSAPETVPGGNSLAEKDPMGLSNGVFFDLDQIAKEIEGKPEAEQQQALSAMVKDVVDLHFSTIYLDAWSSGTAAYLSDTLPLKSGGGFSVFDYIIQVAQKREISTVLWVDPLPQPGKVAGFVTKELAGEKYLDLGDEATYKAALETLKELLSKTSRYSLAGVVLDIGHFPGTDGFLFPYDLPEEDPAFGFVKETGAAVKAAGMSFAVMDSNFLTKDSYRLPFGSVAKNWQTPLESYFKKVGAATFLPVLDVPIKRYAPMNDFSYRLEFLADIFKESQQPWIPILVDQEMADIYEMTAQTVMVKGLNQYGLAYQDYTALSKGEANLSGRIGSLLSDQKPRDLSVEKGFSVTRPEENLVLTGSSYYIMGVADPDKSLTVERKAPEGSSSTPSASNSSTVDGEKEKTAVTDRGAKGSFGYYAKDLQKGENVFTFWQGEESRSITLTYDPDYQKPKEEPKKIGVISQSSMAPSYDTAVDSGAVLTLKCTAPSKSTVKAKLGGKLVTLKQSAEAEEGIAASFAGSVKMDGAYGAGAVEALGPVEYLLDYQGKATTYTSTGQVYAVGKGAHLMVASTSTLTPTYETEELAGKTYDYYQVLGTGTVSEVKSSKNEAYYELAQGGFVQKAKMRILKGEWSEPASQVTQVQYASDNERESFRFVGGDHASFGKLRYAEDQSAVTIYLYNIVSGPAAIGQIKNALKTSGLYSGMFSSIDYAEETINDAKAIKLTFAFREGAPAILGYGVDYEGKDVILSFRKKVDTGTKKEPLKGKVIYLDPGHGGTDSGAPGPPQKMGPREKDMTLPIAVATKEKLESLGARVYMTRNADVAVDLYERAAISQKVKPDAFLSLHLNSIDEKKNAGAYFGTKIYYYSDSTIPLAREVQSGVVLSTYRDDNGIEQGAYVVAMPTTFPALLCELGYISHPDEGDKMKEAEDQKRTAEGIANALVDYFHPKEKEQGYHSGDKERSQKDEGRK